MGLINPTLPTLGQPFASEASDVGNALQTIVTEINGLLDSANIEDGSIAATDLAPDVLGVPRTVFEVGGAWVPGSAAAGTYVLASSAALFGSNQSQNATAWNPVAADFVVAGKTAQVRLVATQAVNATAPGVTFTVGLQGLTGVAGGIGAMIFTLQAASMTAVITTPGAGTAGPRIASSWVNLSALSGNASHVLTVTLSGTAAANSVTSLSAAVEMRHV